jgi:hypothetical protein
VKEFDLTDLEDCGGRVCSRIATDLATLRADRRRAAEARGRDDACPIAVRRNWSTPDIDPVVIAKVLTRRRSRRLGLLYRLAARARLRSAHTRARRPADIDVARDPRACEAR